MAHASAVEVATSARSVFRYRGREVTRIEAFSDAVFGFALTLLVVSLEVPRTFAELMATMRGFVAFAFCFAMLFMLWALQNDFFRRYGLTDGLTIWLNAALLFLVMVFVYPLKFLATLLVDLFTGVPLVVGRPDGTEVPVILSRDVPRLMAVYGLALLAVFVLFAILHAHAWQKRRTLGLDAFEAYEAMTFVWAYAITALVPLASILVARIGGPPACFAAGLIYGLIGPAMGGTAAVRNRLRSRRRWDDRGASSQSEGDVSGR